MKIHEYQAKQIMEAYNILVEGGDMLVPSSPVGWVQSLLKIEFLEKAGIKVADYPEFIPQELKKVLNLQKGKGF